MSKFARNRVMFFGSWTGSAVSESATATITGTGITNATVTAATFGSAVNSTSGEYVFTHDGTSWKYNGTVVQLTSYGLTATGTPDEGDIITVNYTAASGGWEALGKDNDELTKELNPDTETGKNVLGESYFTHSGYEPEVSVEPYYADPSRKLYNHLMEVAMQEKYGESDLLGYFAEAHFTAANETTRTMTGFAFVRRAWIVPQSIGGDTSGVAIPFTVQPVGAATKKAVSYNMETNEATFTDWNE